MNTTEIFTEKLESLHNDYLNETDKEGKRILRAMILLTLELADKLDLVYSFNIVDGVVNYETTE